MSERGRSEKGKSAALVEIVEFVAQKLDVKRFQSIDSAHNGLQIEGRREVRRIAASVDAGLSVVEDAVSRKADLLLVHHGLLWGTALPITGPHREVVSKFLQSGLSLLAAHLPLDADADVGNNIAIAQLLQLTGVRPCAQYHGVPIGILGNNSSAHKLVAIAAQLQTLTGSAGKPLTLPFGPNPPEKIAIVTGSGAEFIRSYATEGFDTLITGEPRQFAYHFAREHRVNAIFAGHYATETLGVQNLARLISERFGIEWEFLDHPTGI